MPDPITAPVVPAPAVAAPVTPPPVPARPVQGTPPPAAPAVTPGAPVIPPAGMVPLPALQEERTKRQELEAEVGRLRAQVGQVQQQQHQPQAVAQVDPKVELEKLWDTDPRKAVQVEIMYAMDWRDRVDASLNAQADQLALKYPDFNNYRSSTLGYIRTLPAHQRGAAGILEAAYYMVRGQNVDQLLQARETELLDKYRRGEITAQQLAVPAGSFSTPASPQGTTLTADQLAVAGAMGMSPEAYASQIKVAPGGR